MDQQNTAPGSRPRLALFRRQRTLFFGALIAVFALLFAGVATASANSGGHHPVPQPNPSATPRSADQIPNITLVENEIKAYYDDTLVGTDHVPSKTGNYAKEVAGIEKIAQRYLATAHVSHSSKAKKAVVFDIDDTTLNTYNYEIFSSFAYNPTTNAEYVNDARFPEVYGMPALVNWANSRGYTVFFITGRPEAQRPGTVTNLAKVGYTVPTDPAHLYLKYAAGSQPAYITCAAAACTTIEYKSQTRKHIESLGYDIVANFGDQFSDLSGGFADRDFKMPNPMYYLP
ncbi:HAD family acid phosphatase [Jatrophihabitans sp. DSM 45814]